ncbi:hypothetical protein Q2T40_00405 [Winogradskyella maritima]|nr:hypothetical protein [Winogradskyella maritima]
MIKETLWRQFGASIDMLEMQFNSALLNIGIQRTNFGTMPIIAYSG